MRSNFQLERRLDASILFFSAMLCLARIKYTVINEVYTYICPDVKLLSLFFDDILQ